jgi:hypothetical protein
VKAAKRQEKTPEAEAIELASLRAFSAVLKSEVLPVVEGLVVILDGELRSAGERRAKEITRYIQPLRAIQYILHKRLDD